MLIFSLWADSFNFAQTHTPTHSPSASLALLYFSGSAPLAWYDRTIVYESYNLSGLAIASEVRWGGDGVSLRHIPHSILHTTHHFSTTSSSSACHWLPNDVRWRVQAGRLYRSSRTATPLPQQPLQPPLPVTSLPPRHSTSIPPKLTTLRYHGPATSTTSTTSPYPTHRAHFASTQPANTVSRTHEHITAAPDVCLYDDPYVLWLFLTHS